MLALIQIHSSLSSQKQLGAPGMPPSVVKKWKHYSQVHGFQTVPRAVTSGERHHQPECTCWVAGVLQSWEGYSWNSLQQSQSLGTVVLGCGVRHPGPQQLTLQGGKWFEGPNKAVEDDWGAEGSLGFFFDLPLLATSLVPQVRFPKLKVSERYLTEKAWRKHFQIEVMSLARNNIFWEVQNI